MTVDDWQWIAIICISISTMGNSECIAQLRGWSNVLFLKDFILNLWRKIKCLLQNLG